MANACCDLKNKVKVKCVIYPERPHNGWYFNTIRQVYLYRYSAIRQLLFPIWLTLERSTLAYKSKVKDHSDLIFWLQGAIDQKHLHAWLEDRRCHRDKTCHTSKLAKSNFKCLLWPWKWGQGQTCGLSRKAFAGVIFWHHWKVLSVQTLCNTAISVPH